MYPSDFEEESEWRCSAYSCEPGLVASWPPGWTPKRLRWLCRIPPACRWRPPGGACSALQEGRAATIFQVDGNTAPPVRAAAAAAADTWVAAEGDDLAEYLTAVEPEELPQQAAEGLPPRRGEPLLGGRAGSSQEPGWRRRLGPRDVIEEPARDLTAANWDRLRHLAGRPPPRTGRHEAQTLEPQAADVAASFAELLAGVGEEPATAAEDSHNQLLHKLLVMQTALLERSLAVGEEPATAAEDSHNQLLHKLLVMQTALLERSLASKPSDSVTAALATGGSDNTAGVRGYAAREAFLRQLGQHRDVAAAVASNAARELGLLESQDGHNEGNELLQSWASRGLMFCEQEMSYLEGRMNSLQGNQAPSQPTRDEHHEEESGSTRRPYRRAKAKVKPGDAAGK
eukprot:s11085_g3.t1